MFENPIRCNRWPLLVVCLVLNCGYVCKRTSFRWQPQSILPSLGVDGIRIVFYVHSTRFNEFLQEQQQRTQKRMREEKHEEE